jgi:hypothetical protein
MPRLNVTSVLHHVIDLFGRFQERASRQGYYEGWLIDDSPEGVEIFARDIMRLQEGCKISTSLECNKPEASVRYDVGSL